MVFLQKMQGIVVKSTGSWYRVKLESNDIVDARIKGKFRTIGIRTTNPIAVGDNVFLEKENENFVISKLGERKNYIIRKSINLSKHSHIIAANIDQALLLVTIEQPETSTGFIDRFIVTAEAYHIPVVIAFNKLDIYSSKSQQKLEYLSSMYSKIGYRCISVSATTELNIDDVRSVLKNKTSVVVGHSGAGKSTLLNTIEPTLDIKTSKISEVHEQGKHTTTFAEMHELNLGGYLIDTPGVKAFGLIDFEKSDLSHYFIEMRAVLNNCQFNNCQHINEPKCAVKKAVAEGNIAEFRYNNYLSMYYDDEEENYRGKGY